tara:strand:- start:977 stop:1567 length:591 start_codon:yes stop_codon:yes gene_type:complete
MSRSPTTFTDLPVDIQLHLIKSYCRNFIGVSKAIQAYCKSIYTNSATLLAKWYRSRRLWVELFIHYDPARHSLVISPSFHLFTRKTMIRYFLLFNAGSSLDSLSGRICCCSDKDIKLEEGDEYFNSFYHSIEYFNNMIKEVRYFLTKYVNREQMKCLEHSSMFIKSNRSMYKFDLPYIYNTYRHKLPIYNKDSYAD